MDNEDPFLETLSNEELKNYMDAIIESIEIEEEERKNKNGK